MPIYESAPDDPSAEIARIQQMVASVLLIQKFARRAARIRQEVTSVLVIQRVTRQWLKSRPYPAEIEGTPQRASEERDARNLVVKNLDTGEVAEVEVDDSATAPQLSLGLLLANSPEWQTVKRQCRGLLEKLAVSHSSRLSFRSYRLCVWQERYVFADDDAVCYQSLGKDRTPTGSVKRIPYANIEFIGPYDDLQFVVQCPYRSYTFLAETTETRTDWIRNLTQLSGCSASLEVCMRTTSHRRGR